MHNPTYLIEAHLGDKADKRLIITHRKDLNKGHYLIDDREKNGAGDFERELLRFGSERFPNWGAIKKYLLSDTF